MHSDELGDGIYRMESGGAGYVSRTVVVIERGRFFGFGQMGATYRGTCHFDPARKLNMVEVTATMPPDTPLVTGGRVGPQGVIFDFKTETKLQNGQARFSFSLMGRAVDAALYFVRPLPGRATPVVP